VLAEVLDMRPAIETFFEVLPAKAGEVNEETVRAMTVITVMEIVLVLSKFFIDSP
jgi:hypothetical protein